jgi:DNA-directed RNA polymerase specialized sigma24 family protein
MQLIERARRVFRDVSSELIEDAVQDVLEKVLRDPNINRDAAYLHKMVFHKIFDKLRAGRTTNQFAANRDDEGSAEERVADPNAHLFSVPMQRVPARVFEEMIRLLYGGPAAHTPPERSIVFACWSLLDYRPKEIIDRLGELPVSKLVEAILDDLERKLEGICNRARVEQIASSLVAVQQESRVLASYWPSPVEQVAAWIAEGGDPKKPAHKRLCYLFGHELGWRPTEILARGDLNYAPRPSWREAAETEHHLGPLRILR